MGIECLTKYINEHCKSCYYRKSLKYLRNKIIVVDINIYLYKFKQKGNFIEKLYLMCSKFRQNNIIAIFVFDGKPDINKNKCLEIRRKEREAARIEYNNLQQKLKADNLEINDLKQDNKYYIKLNELKSKLTTITQKDIIFARTLFDIMGFQCIQSPYESDIMLASLMYNNSKIWGCMTEDSDLFAYGCKHVIKYFNPYTTMITIYNTNSILFSLDITWREFQEICLLSKNDYHINSKYNFYQAMRMYKKNKNINISLPENPYNKECHIPDILHYNKEIIPNSLAQFLKPHDFIFVKKHPSVQLHS
tara:strand:+ start:6069 stop:6986 length:918 start_codon:yes stop_codon:yes gene_type:complete